MRDGRVMIEVTRYEAKALLVFLGESGLGPRGTHAERLDTAGSEHRLSAAWRVESVLHRAADDVGTYFTTQTKGLIR